MASLSSSSSIVPPSWLSDTNTITLRDASFSSYLNTSEEDYIRTLVTTTNHNTKPVQGDGEIDVFSADKYFSGEVDQKYHKKPGKKLNEKMFTCMEKLQLQPRTPSIHSVSSWNSQSALVKPVQRNSSRRSKIKSSLLSPFYCCDGKSIDIKVYEDNEDKFSSYGDVIFDKEIEREIVTRTIKTSFDTSDIARFNKKKTDTTYDTDMFTFPPVNISEGPFGETYSDTESDASSDLFEISVNWSVVTASAADFSVTDDFEERASTISSVSRSRAVPKSSTLVDTRIKNDCHKGRIAGMFSGCKSQKAVEVIEDVYRSSAGSNRKLIDSESRKMHRLSDCYSPVTRFKAESRHSKNFSSDFLYV